MHVRGGPAPHTLPDGGKHRGAQSWQHPGEAVSLGKERSRWRNVFKGEFINVLSVPNKQLPQGVAI